VLARMLRGLQQK